MSVVWILKSSKTFIEAQILGSFFYITRYFVSLFIVTSSSFPHHLAISMYN
jgi:hypothetical protein